MVSGQQSRREDVPPCIRHGDMVLVKRFNAQEKAVPSRCVQTRERDGEMASCEEIEQT